MKGIKIPLNDAVLVGSSSSDDAGVYGLTEDSALVQTLDFITPIVDDPFTFGRIAACNSLSDVYAMGGRPLTALNIVCFPLKLFSLDKLTAILEGGLSVISQAGVQLLGGHSVEDNELKYGLSVTGLVHPDKILRNNTIRAGDVLVLTKPLGTGVISTAVKAGFLDDNFYSPFVESMTTLNDRAASVMSRYEISACTDITGFGLAGHAFEMLGDNKLTITINSSSIQILPGALDNAAMGMLPAGMYRNRDYVGEAYTIKDSVERERADIIFDPQTSGGLLVAIQENYLDNFIKDLQNEGVTPAHVVGHIDSGKNPGIIIE